MGSDEITLGKVLGEGASAVVYEATDSQGRTVCVKQFKNSIKLEDVERMHRETEVLKRLNHPKIPRIIDVYEADVGGRRLLHVVQEMVDGEDLQSRISQNVSTLPEIQQMLAEILEILVYLHRHQPPVLHRDIKPSNLMRRLDGSIVLIDFGQAIRDVHRTFGQTMLTGTLGYQALEQIIEMPHQNLTSTQWVWWLSNC